MFMHELEWTPTKIVIRNCELEDGPQEDNYHTQTLWTPQQEGPGEGSQGRRTPITTHLHIHQEEDTCKEEEEGDAHVEI